MPNLPNKECTGCSACAMLCPTGAITMAEDAEGFLHPRIENGKCVECGKCEKHCPVGLLREGNDTPAFGVFAAKVRQEEVHKRSQSGGVFYALARAVLEKGGAVYGAALEENFETKHIRVDEIQALGRLQGVKYIQSRLGDGFLQVGRDLKNGVPVLFSGTPCQVAGLYAYLKGRGIPADKLLTCDLVCYGVPSPGVFRQWRKLLEKTYKSKLAAMQYRRTDEKWGKGKEYYRLENGRVLEGGYFTQLYFRDLILRSSCTQCRYCNMTRPGDITLGDFWGIDKVMPEFYDDRGVSLVMCASEKGRQALEEVRDALVLAESNPADAAAAQPRLRGIAAQHSPQRQAFWKDYREKGIAYIAVEEGFIPPTFFYRIRKKLERITGR